MAVTVEYILNINASDLLLSLGAKAQNSHVVCPSIFFSFKFFAISFLEVIFLKVCQKGLDFKVLLRLLFPLFSFQVIYADFAWSFMKFCAFRFCSVSYNLYFFICCFNLLFSPLINAEIPEGNLLFIISNKIQNFYRNITWADFFPSIPS